MPSPERNIKTSETRLMPARPYGDAGIVLMEFIFYPIVSDLFQRPDKNYTKRAFLQSPFPQYVDSFNL